MVGWLHGWWLVGWMLSHYYYVVVTVAVFIVIVVIIVVIITVVVIVTVDIDQHKYMLPFTLRPIKSVSNFNKQPPGYLLCRQRVTQ